MYPHQIRLRGPWSCELVWSGGVPSTESWPSSHRVTLPCRWSATGLAAFEGRVRFRRSFGYPGRIDEYERVWLTLTGVDPRATIVLNQHRLEQTRASRAGLEFDVTNLLQSRNELSIEMQRGAESSDIWREVALEVRCQAFLCDLQRIAILKEDGVDLHVAGHVVGVAERPLELYVLLDGSVVSYQLVTATAPGSFFEANLSDSPLEDWRDADGGMKARVLRIDLVNGAVIWFSNTEAVTLNTDTSGK
jgi:hypothetical protein